jgi:hypothetical protein
MKSRGRPRAGAVQLKDGFYIEVCNMGVKRGMKIRSENKKAMDDSASLYSKDKDVIVLGEYKNGIPIIEIPRP